MKENCFKTHTHTIHSKIHGILEITEHLKLKEHRFRIPNLINNLLVRTVGQSKIFR